MKVAIIGAGPAGLSAAIFLAEKNVKVTLYEAYRVGENIICAEGFFDFTGLLNLDLPFATKINKIIVLDKEEFHITLPIKTNFYTFDRANWQKNLKNVALSKGAQIIENCKISQKDLFSLSKENDFVIDATGVKAISHCLFPKKELITYRKGLMPTFQYTIKGDFSSYKGAIKAVILNDPPGYYWFFPKFFEDGTSVANVGLGYLSKNKKPPNLKTLLKELLENSVNSDYAVLCKKSSPIPTKRLKLYRKDNVILVGDALGLCSPLHGGGIDSAYLSGLYAAKAIVNKNFNIYKSFIKRLDRRYLKERIIVKLWELFGSTKILMKLKHKGLFEDNSKNIPFTNDWLKKALFTIIFR